MNRQLEAILHAAALHGVLPAALRALKTASPLVGATLDDGISSELENAEQAIAAARAQRIHETGFELLLKYQGEVRDYRAGVDYFEDNWRLAADPSVSVEVHSNLVHNPRLRQTASITLEQVTDAGAGDTEDATAILFVAAAHGAISHQLDRLQHLVDVALAANGAAGEIVAERLARAARASGVLTAVHAALVVTGKAFHDRRCLTWQRLSMHRRSRG